MKESIVLIILSVLCMVIYNLKIGKRFAFWVSVFFMFLSISYLYTVPYIGFCLPAMLAIASFSQGFIGAYGKEKLKIYIAFSAVYYLMIILFLVSLFI